jgi:hypothetical protein
MSNQKPTDNEFGEIANCGGKIELLNDGQGISIRVSGTGPTGYAQMGIALDGSRMVFQPIGGIDTRPQKEPEPLVPTFLPADRTGFWGRECPKCKAYFRTTSIRERMYCSYCNFSTWAAAFTTKNQREFLNVQRELWLAAIGGRSDVMIDLDSIAANLPANRPSWVPTEERQQFKFRCESCHIFTDILGDYGTCPCCGRRNSFMVFQTHIGSLDEEFSRAAKELTDRREREQKWEALLPRYISVFEAMASDIHIQLMALPMTPTRRKELSGLSFQQIQYADRMLRDWFGIELMGGLKSEDCSFLNQQFNRRHLLVHRAGRADEEYLKKTGDTSVKLHQRVRARSAEVSRLSKLLSRCASSFFDQFLSIHPNA